MCMYTHRYTYYFNVNLGNSTNICVVHLCSMYISYVGKYLGSNTSGLTCSILDFFDPSAWHTVHALSIFMDGLLKSDAMFE